MGARTLIHERVTQPKGTRELIYERLTRPVPITVPTKFADRPYMPTPMTRGSFFYPILEAKRINEPVFREVWGATVEQDVILLTPKHAPVITALLKIAEDTDNSDFGFTVYQVGALIYGRPPSGEEYESLRQYIKDLSLVWVSLRYLRNGERHRLYTYLMSLYVNEDTDQMRACLNIKLAELLTEGALTPLDGKVMLKMRSRTGLLLYMFYTGQERFYGEAGQYAINEKDLFKVVGMDIIMKKEKLPPSRAREYLVSGFKELKKYGLIADWEFNKRTETYTAWARQPKAKAVGTNPTRPPVKPLPQPQPQAEPPARAPIPTSQQQARQADPLAQQLQAAYNAQGWPGGNRIDQFTKAAGLLRDFAQRIRHRFVDHRFRATAERVPENLPGMLVPMVIEALKAGKAPQHPGWVTNDLFWETDLDVFLTERGKLEPASHARPRGRSVE